MIWEIKDNGKMAISIDVYIRISRGKWMKVWGNIPQFAFIFPDSQLSGNL